MADITFNIGLDSSYGSVAVRKTAGQRLRKVKFTNQEQFAIATYLFGGGTVGAVALVLYLMIQEGVFLY